MITEATLIFDHVHPKKIFINFQFSLIFINMLKISSGDIVDLKNLQYGWSRIFQYFKIGILSILR